MTSLIFLEHISYHLSAVHARAHAKKSSENLSFPESGRFWGFVFSPGYAIILAEIPERRGALGTEGAAEKTASVRDGQPRGGAGQAARSRL